MADILIEMDARHTDDEDMSALVTLIADAGYSAAATEQTMLNKAAWWVLAFRWVGDPAIAALFSSGLDAVGKKVAHHFRGRNEPPPQRIDLYGPDGEVIKSVEIPNEPD